jgi:hypothetical protein
MCLLTQSAAVIITIIYLARPGLSDVFQGGKSDTFHRLRYNIRIVALAIAILDAFMPIIDLHAEYPTRNDARVLLAPSA